MGERETGIVAWFHDGNGQGIIRRDDGEEIVVHYRAIAGIGYRTLREGQRVEFSVHRAPEGNRAEDVIILG